MELPQFALVMLRRQDGSHAMEAGDPDGPALCGLEPPAAGWFLEGCTSRLYRIDCHTCRERAAAVLSALSARADPSTEVRDG